MARLLGTIAVDPHMIVMAGLDPAIGRSKRSGATRGAIARVASDGRIKSGHDDLVCDAAVAGI
jgi:hypothetical protein